jgi:hypothetical protein
VRRVLRVVAGAIAWLVIALLAGWCVAALAIDVRVAGLRIPLAVVYALIVIVVAIKFRFGVRAGLICVACTAVVMVWWFSLAPTNVGDWQEDVSRVASAEIHGDTVTIHNLRNCHYVTEKEYSDCWSDRTVKLSDLRHMDLFFTTWGVKWIGHPIVSFDFGNGQHIAFSIEARYKGGQDYSALLGFFRQYELIFVAADEMDLIRLRTNFRKDEEVFLYRLNLDPAVGRAIFTTYIGYLDKLHDHPEWYNALTRNCTTTLDTQIAASVPNPKPWNYQLLLNGTLDELLYERGRFVTDGLPFAELKQRAHINPVAHQAGNSADFSALIREGRPGFED